MTNPQNLIRQKVSGQRRRFVEDGYNLDLTYITHRIIAMGFPAEKVEAVYRNNREDVTKLLNEKHHLKYKVYNLCKEKTYDATAFPFYAEYPFEDHNPPSIDLINNFCEDVHRFLSQDQEHVVAIHCKAGKGRTGTMICCYLLYSKACQTGHQALSFYAEKRTRDKKGVTIPSQLRYVHYYDLLLRNRLQYETVSLYVCELRIFPADVAIKLVTIKMMEGKDALQLTEIQRTEDCVTVLPDVCMPLMDDVVVEFVRVRNLKEKRWHFWFNTFFVLQAAICDTQDRYVLTLDRMEIDNAHKGNTKKCPEQVQVFLKPVPAGGKYLESVTPSRKQLQGHAGQPLVDGNQTYNSGTTNNMYHHRHHQHHALQPQLQQQPLQLSTNANNFNNEPVHYFPAHVANNNRASLGNSQQQNTGSGIYGNIGNHSHQPFDANTAASSPSSKTNHKKQPSKPSSIQPVMATAAHQQHHLNHSGGSSEEISGTDSVEDEDEYEDGDEKEEEDEDEDGEGEEGWDSGECQTVVSQTMCKSRTNRTTTTTTTTSTTTKTTSPTTTNVGSTTTTTTATTTTTTSSSTTIPPNTTTTTTTRTESNQQCSGSSSSSSSSSSCRYSSSSGEPLPPSPASPLPTETGSTVTAVSAAAAAAAAAATAPSSPEATIVPRTKPKLSSILPSPSLAGMGVAITAAAAVAAAPSSPEAARTVFPNNSKFSSIHPPPSPRYCPVNDENYLLTRSSSYLISNSSSTKSSCPAVGGVTICPGGTDANHQSASELVPVGSRSVSGSQFSPSEPAGKSSSATPPASSSPTPPGRSAAVDSSLALMVYEPRSLVPLSPANRVHGADGTRRHESQRLPASPSPSKGGFPLLLARRLSKATAPSIPLLAGGGTAKASSSGGVGAATVTNPSCVTVTRDGGSTAGGSGDGDGSGKSKLLPSSPFRRFGMAMQRTKKRSLKLKHVNAGTGTTLYGSCASNLSGVSGGNGGGKGGVPGGTSGGVISSGKSKMKFRWLRNMRSDPNLKDTLARSVQLRSVVKKGSLYSTVDDQHPLGGGSSTSASGVMIPKSPTDSKMFFARDSALDGGRRERPSGLADNVAKGARDGNHHHDYYSFLCDNQLSYESPSKSPGHLMRSELALARRPSTIEEVRVQQQPPSTVVTTVVPDGCEAESGCSVVKPRATNVKIGFDVSPVPQSPVGELRSDDADNFTSIESSFEIINKCDAMTVSTVESKLATETGAVGAGGNRFCNKLLQHIVSSVGTGRKGEHITLAANEGVGVPSKPQGSSTGSVEKQQQYKWDADVLHNSPSLEYCPRTTSASLPATPTKPAANDGAARSGGSPILARSNRCAPFSFRELSQELRAAMKIPKRTPSQASSSATTPAPSSSSSSSSFSNVGSGTTTTVRSIERTLSAPVAVQSLDTSVTAGPTTSTASTAATTAMNATGATGNHHHPQFTLNRSQSDRQLLGEDRSQRSK